jgi:hypothetical protein
VDSPNFNTLETGTRLKTWRQERKQGQLVVEDGETSKPTQTLGCSRSLFKNVPCADPKSTMNNSSGKHDGRSDAADNQGKTKSIHQQQRTLTVELQGSMLPGDGRMVHQDITHIRLSSCIRESVHTSMELA